MYLPVLTAALLVALSVAKPVSPSTISNITSSTSAADTKPSDYPLGDPCKHEWKYLHFDARDSKDADRLKKIHKAICHDVPQLAAAADYSILGENNPNTIYYRFFPGADKDGDYPAQVQSVFARFVDIPPEDLSSLVTTFVVDNNDFANVCGELRDGHIIGGFTGFDEDGQEKTHICEAAYDSLPDLDNIKCDDIGPRVDEKMNNFARVILHEICHWSSVGPKSKLEAQIVDAKNEDEKYAYGPERTHGLEDPSQDDQDGLALVNADNYAWFATNSYFSIGCNDKEPYEAPANYDSESGEVAP